MVNKEENMFRKHPKVYLLTHSHVHIMNIDDKLRFKHPEPGECNEIEVWRLGHPHQSHDTDQARRVRGLLSLVECS